MSSNRRIQGQRSTVKILAFFGKVSVNQKECCLGMYLGYWRSIFLLFRVFYGTLYTVTLVPDFQKGLSMVDLDDWKGSPQVTVVTQGSHYRMLGCLFFSAMLFLSLDV